MILDVVYILGLVNTKPSLAYIPQTEMTGCVVAQDFFPSNELITLALKALLIPIGQ